MEDMYKYLLEAFKEARKSEEEGTFPIGAVLVDELGNIVARGRNKVFSNGDATAHAEVDVIRKASSKLLDVKTRTFLENNLTLYSTCEPCPMCTGTILLSNIKKVVWAASDHEFGALSKVKEGPHFIKYYSSISYISNPYPDLEQKQRGMMAKFYSGRGYHDTEWHKELDR